MRCAPRSTQNWITTQPVRIGGVFFRNALETAPQRSELLLDHFSIRIASFRQESSYDRGSHDRLRESSVLHLQRTPGRFRVIHDGLLSRYHVAHIDLHRRRLLDEPHADH